MAMAGDVEVLELPNPPQPPTHRLPSTCDRHPNENFTGFCASCLRERLAGLESTTSTTHRNSTSTISSSIKSIFFRPQGHPSSSFSSLQPELRRCKSFSCGRADGAPPRISTSFEPQRKSCDVRGRNTLWSLFHRDDNDTSSAAAASSLPVTVIEEEHYEDADEIRPVDPVLLETSRCEISNVGVRVGFGIGIGERKVEEVEAVASDLKPMKDHIDLESQPKKAPAKDFKEIAGSFWLAASVFSKKLQKWRRKQKLKKMKKEEEEERKPGPKSSSSRRFRDTQLEIIAFGRRSCDTDPRFSLDAGRISFDDPRYSLDEPRASWDGYLIGAGAGAGAGAGTGCRSLFHRHLPPMLSVVEDTQRSDGHIPVEEDLMTLPGGSAQTKDYYSDSSSSRSRRRSLDRSNSVRKTISVEMNHQKLPAVRVSPVANANEDIFFRREWSSNSLRSDRSECFDSAHRQLPPRGKSKRWSKAWSIWGFIHRRSCSRGGVSSNVAVDRSFSEPWPKTLQSNSSVGSRSSQYGGNASFGSTRRGNGIEKKRKEEFVLERNPSGRYSPKRHVDNGMLRFYLTPMRSSSRRGVGKNVQPNSSYQSFARSVLRLY